MRGVITAGMLSALEELGLRDCFDAVYGSSAGAFAAAYFIAGQARYGSSIFQEVNNRRFINLWRIALGRPAISMEVLVDYICATRKPLDFERLQASGIPLRVIAASVERKCPVVLTTSSIVTICCRRYEPARKFHFSPARLCVSGVTDFWTRPFTYRFPACNR